MSENQIQFDVHWDIDKYRTDFDEEYWEPCRAFMNAHKSKYPESRLVQLTNAFYNIGIEAQSYDIKTTRMVTALAVEILEDFQEADYEQNFDDEDTPTDCPPEESSAEDSIEEDNKSGNSSDSEGLHLMKQEDLKELLKGFIIVCGVTKKSFLKNQLECLNESFLLSRFKTRTWNAVKSGVDNSQVRVSFSVNNHILAQCVGEDEMTVQKQIAQALLKRIAEFAPTIQANWSYYRDGVLPSLPNPNSAAVFRIINDTSSEDNSRILNLIDNFVELTSNFKELIFVKVGEFQKKLISQHVDGKWNTKLTYRLAAAVDKQGNSTEMVFVYHIHSSDVMLKWLSLSSNGSHNEQYSLVPPTNSEVIDEINNIKVEKDEESSTQRLDDFMYDPNIKIKIEPGESTNEEDKMEGENKSKHLLSVNIENIKKSNIQEKSNHQNVTENTRNKINYKRQSTYRSHRDELIKHPKKVESFSIKECADNELKSLLKGFVLFHGITRNSERDRCTSVSSLNNLFRKLNFKPLEVQYNMHNRLWIYQLKWNNKILAIGEHEDGSKAEANAVQKLCQRLEKFFYTVETNEGYLCDGDVPNFILNPNPMRTDIYRLVYREDLMDSESINFTINEFCKENTFAELIFGPDFSWDVKKGIVSYIESCELEYRFFSSNKQLQPSHLAVYHPVNPRQLKDHLLKNKGKNQKFKLVLPIEMQNKAKKDNEKSSKSDKNKLLGGDTDRRGTKRDSAGGNKELPKQYKKESPGVNKSKRKYNEKGSSESEVTTPGHNNTKRLRKSYSFNKETSSLEKIDDRSRSRIDGRSRNNVSAEKDIKSPERKCEKVYRKLSKEKESKSPERKDGKRTRSHSEEKDMNISETKDARRSENKSCHHHELILWIGVKENSTLNKNLFTILDTSLRLADETLAVRRTTYIDKGLKFYHCNLKRDTRDLGQGSHESWPEAKVLAVCDAFKKLRKECYAIQPLDSYFRKGRALPPSDSKPEFLKLSRNKFYSIDSFLRYIEKAVESFPSREYIFGRDFSKLECESIKRHCKIHGISFREINIKEEDSHKTRRNTLSYIAVWKEFSPTELKRKLMSDGGKSDKYILIPPGGKMSPPDSAIDYWPETLEIEVDNTPGDPMLVKDKKIDNSNNFWLPRKAFENYVDFLVMCKLVKQDSTTESDPVNLLKSTCSVIYDIEFIYTTYSSSRNDDMRKVVLTLKFGDIHILVGEGISLEQESAAQIAAKQAVHIIQSTCRVIEPNPEYFAEGKVPSFIASRKTIKTATYEIVSMENMMKIPLNQDLVEKILQMFQKSEIEDLFFLVTDFSREERTLVTQIADKFKLGWRLFGPRAPKTKAGDVVSSQHVCVFKHKSARDIVKQVISKGGATDKYLLYRNGKRLITISEEDAATGEEKKKDFQVVSHTKEDHTCLNDCPRYFKSTCPKGNKCPLRHEPNAKSSLIVCALWKKGKCYDKKCIKRHMEVSLMNNSSSWHDEPEEEEDYQIIPETSKPITSTGNSTSTIKSTSKVIPKVEPTYSNIVNSKETVNEKDNSNKILKPNPMPSVDISKPPPLINNSPKPNPPNVQNIQSNYFMASQSQSACLPLRQVSMASQPQPARLPPPLQVSMVSQPQPSCLPQLQASMASQPQSACLPHRQVSTASQPQLARLPPPLQVSVASQPQSACLPLRQVSSTSQPQPACLPLHQVSMASQPQPARLPPPLQVSMASQLQSACLPPSLHVPNVLPSPTVSNPIHNSSTPSFQPLPPRASPSFVTAHSEHYPTNKMLDIENKPKVMATAQNELPKVAKEHFTLHNIVPIYDDAPPKPTSHTSAPFLSNNPSSLYKQFTNSIQKLPNNFIPNSSTSFQYPFGSQKATSSSIPQTEVLCSSEGKIGGCNDNCCKYVHWNLLDVIVNRYLQK